MVKAPLAKRVTTIVWSIGLGVFLMGITAKVMFSGTHSGSKTVPQGGNRDAVSTSANNRGQTGDAEVVESSGMMFGSKSPKINMFNGEGLSNNTDNERTNDIEKEPQTEARSTPSLSAPLDSAASDYGQIPESRQ